MYCSSTQQSVYLHPQGFYVPFQHTRPPQVDGGFGTWKLERCKGAGGPGAQKDPGGCREG